MGRGKSKGADHERALCGLFSLWWTWDERDDVFWRAQGSGGRGTRRARRGVDTHGQHGDIAATHPCGEPFTDFLTLELKRGYTTHPIIDICDRPSKGVATALQQWDLFFNQVIESHTAAGTYAWLVVSRRDYRPTWVYMPRYLCRGLRGVGAMRARPRPYMSFVADVRNNGRVPGQWLDIVGVTLDYWFTNVKPEHIEKLIDDVHTAKK